MFCLLLLTVFGAVGKTSSNDYFNALWGQNYDKEAQYVADNDYNDYNYNEMNQDNIYNYGNADEDEIIGGVDAYQGEFSSLVRIVGGSCGGTIIAKSWILTAAHCVKNGKKYTIVAGDVQISKTKGTEQSIAGKAIVYSKYQGRPWIGGGNVALIKLDSKLKFNKHVNRVRLAKNAGQSTVGKDDNLIVAGWGGSVTTKDKLSGVSVKPQPAKDCKAAFGRGAGLDAQTKCVTTKHTSKTICGGDNGGAGYLYTANGRMLQVGIVTWGLITCDQNAAYIDVYHYLKWISDTTGIPQDELTSHVISDTDWMCIVGLDTPLRVHNGDVECMSNDDTNCIWGECLLSIRNFYHTKDKTSLSCGEEHKGKHGNTGYGKENHWCYKARKYFTNNKEWRCLHGAKTPLRKLGDVECMSRDDKDCIWSNKNDGCAWHILIYAHTLDDTSLSCGAEHKKVHGATGYRNEEHWCTLGQTLFS